MRSCPQTLAELDQYAKALDVIDTAGHIKRAGYLPMEPGWYVDFAPVWFGGSFYDSANGRFTLDSPANVAAFEWIAGYSKQLGSGATVEFHDAAGGFDSPQNPFLVGEVAMEQQGPWMANYFYRLTHKTPWEPSICEAQVPRERENELRDRRDNYEWAAAPFPSAIGGMENVSYCSADTLVIPRAARHPDAAFEFMAYLTRQYVMEKLCTLHCKSSPLRFVSREFLDRHPNPYISVFEALSASPNAKFAPQMPMWEQLKKELDDAAQSVSRLDAEPPRLSKLHKRDSRKSGIVSSASTPSADMRISPSPGTPGEGRGGGRTRSGTGPHLDPPPEFFAMLAHPMKTWGGYTRAPLPFRPSGGRARPPYKY